MPNAPQPVLEITDVEKRYQALRPLRLQALTIAPAERVAIVGLDAGGAEVLVNLVTGASVADRGTVRVRGRDNADIANGDEWLASLDRFGIVSARAVLLEGATLEQNLAMPFTLQIDPVAPDIAERVVSLASACGLSVRTGGGTEDPVGLRRLAGECSPEVKSRAHLARAVALDPVLLVLEHPTIGLAGTAVAASDRCPPDGDVDSDSGSELRAPRVAPCAEVESGDGCDDHAQTRMVQVTDPRTRDLLRDHTTGHSRPAAHAGLRLAGRLLVFVAVDDDGGAVRIEERQRTGRQRNPRGDAGQFARAIRADLEVGNVSHVEGMVGIRIGIACRTRIEMAARRGEVWFTLPDSVQMNTVLAGLQSLGVECELDEGGCALFTFRECESPCDALALDVGVGFHARRLGAQSRRATQSNRGRGQQDVTMSHDASCRRL